MDSGLKQYIEDSILPMYDDFPSQRAQSEKLASLLCRVQPGLAVKQFDAAHRRDHVEDEALLRSKFDYLYEVLTNSHLIGCNCPQC